MQNLRQLRRSTDEILAYQNPLVIERYMRDYAASEPEAQRCFYTLKQFLAACATAKGDRVASKPVDNMWHTFILFTKDYEKFCEDYLGRFVHHAPNQGASSGLSLSTRPLAERLFGRVYEDLWPINAVSDCESSSCDCCPAI